MKSIILILVVLLYSQYVRACIELTATSSTMGTLTFFQISIEDDTSDRSGRASYVSTNTEKTVYLYHTSTDGLGRWVLNDALGSKEYAMGYINSWAIAPYIVYPISDNFWKFPQEDESGAQLWNDDADFDVQCINYSSGDSSFYFESSPALGKDLAGFFVLRSTNAANRDSDVYSLIKPINSDMDLYMYKFEEKWMIGATIGQDSSFAFIDDNAATPAGIEKDEWRFISTDETSEAVWQYDYGYIYSHENVKDDNRVVNAYDALFYYRSIKYIPKGQRYLTLRNSLPMPTLGLGTGGIAPENMKDVIKNALNLGYRSFDLAREYGNEWVIPEALAEIESETAPSRREIFIESKVWPTDLGFYPTYDAIMESLRDVKSNYIDSYLIHWPKCDPNIEWMHCQDTKDPEGTWLETWQAMEKFYAEGRLMSIGVSNFNVNLLTELLASAVVKPHLIQNWSEPGSHDDAVREFSMEHNIIYQPYASLRNLNSISPSVLEKLQVLANEKKVSVYQVALRFFVQTGCAVIPRSTKTEHLKENLDVFSWSLSREEMNSLGWTKEMITEEEKEEL